jgi:deoxyribodipyrimidine photo-lyase
VYIHDEARYGDWPPGAAAKWWLDRALRALSQSLEDRGLRLIIRAGDAAQHLGQLTEQTNASTVVANACYEPAARRHDQAVGRCLAQRGVELAIHHDALLYEPGSVLTQQDKPYSVFTPFWRACMQMPQPEKPVPIPKTLTGPKDQPDSTAIGELGFEPTARWNVDLAEHWTVSEPAALGRLGQFVTQAIADYDDQRNRPDLDATSRLSPYLAHGLISPRQVYHMVVDHLPDDHRRRQARAGWSYLRQLGWREFAYHMLYHEPDVARSNWRSQFDRFPWREDEQAHDAWQRGRTGYPIVDAAMRQLWQTGWMHNRLRMIVASFLTKDLMIHWLAGARWFWDTLVDADLANNSLGWQWTAGCGPDAAPYFRVFNPLLQGQKFDPQGRFVRQYLPELAALPDRWIHKPFETPQQVLAEAGVQLGRDYPRPIVDHQPARDRALAAYDRIKAGRGAGIGES